MAKYAIPEITRAAESWLHLSGRYSAAFAGGNRVDHRFSYGLLPNISFESISKWIKRIQNGSITRLRSAQIADSVGALL